eukprot:5182675-Prymnesium_polylepis.1
MRHAWGGVVCAGWAGILVESASFAVSERYTSSRTHWSPGPLLAPLPGAPIYPAPTCVRCVLVSRTCNEHCLETSGTESTRDARRGWRRCAAHAEKQDAK